MDTIFVLELDIPANVRVLQPDHTPADPEHPVLRAHTAPAEPSGMCGPLTLCGLATTDMTLAPRRRTHDRPRWHACSSCQTIAASTAPEVAGPPGLDVAGHG
ncbi:hypothetical protein ACFVSN_30015 [Kitasatospora sp. NPDC057904]|uniref:hypothetical protein n=1 Tax=unclassified Kitasatospora TaxID=2633591 RepID=UPI0036DEAA10